MGVVTLQYGSYKSAKRYMNILNETMEDTSVSHQRVLTGSYARDDTCTLVTAGCGLRAAKVEGGSNRGAFNCDGYAYEYVSESVFQFGRRLPHSR